MKSRRTRLLPATAALVALSLTAACGGGSDSDDADGAKSPTPEGSSSGSDGEGKDDGKNGDTSNGGDSAKGDDESKDPKPGNTDKWPKSPAKGELSDDKLAEYALAQGDVPGFKVNIPSKSELAGMGEEKAKDAKCQPLGGLMAGTPQPEPSEAVYRSMLPEPDEQNPSGLVLFETLAAYDGNSADAFLAKLRKALKDCADGFETAAKGDQGIGKYTGVKELKKPKLKGADDVLAFQLDGAADGQEIPILFNVVRTDSTVAVFYAMNVMQPKAAVIPEIIARIQTDKLT